MSTEYKAYIFDIDGTVLDTAPRILASIREALALCEVRYALEDINQHLIGPKIADILDILGVKGDEKLKTKVVKTFREIYDNNPITGTSIYPQMQELLSKLKNNNIQCFVATNKPKKPLMQLLQFFNLDFFDDIYCPDKYDTQIMSKTEMIAEIIEKYHLAPATILYIGDTKGDYEACAKNNCPFGFASWGYEQDKKSLKKLAHEVLI